jgi:hypothetical protein
MDQEPDKRRRLQRRTGRCCALLAFLALLPAGCTTSRAQIERALGGVAVAPVIREQTVEEGYRIACPDVVEITVVGHRT